MERRLMVVALVVIGVCLLAPPAAWAQDKPAAAADPVSGEWEGLVADQNVAFTLKLKLDGDKVTGEVGGSQGATPITTGSWSASDSKLTFAFTYVDGAAIQMSGLLKDGELTGSLTYGGQMVMSWTAKKKAQ